MSTMYKKSFSDADEIKTPPKAHVSVVKLGDMNASKLILEPGWKWSECIKPVGGDSCQAGHVGVITQGKLMCVHKMEQKFSRKKAMHTILPQVMTVG